MIQDRDCGDENDARPIDLSLLDWDRIANDHADDCKRCLREIAAFNRMLREKYEQSVRRRTDLK